MKFIKLINENGSDLWLEPKKIESIESISKEDFELIKRQSEEGAEAVYYPSIITMDSGETWHVRNTSDEIFEMFRITALK